MMKPFEFWSEKLRESMKNRMIHDITDLNASSCLTYMIAADSAALPFGSDAMKAYAEEGNTAYYVKVQISLKTDMMCIRFCKYEGSPAELTMIAEPQTEEGKEIYRTLLSFAFENGVKIKRYVMLNNTMIGEESAYALYFEPAAVSVN